MVLFVLLSILAFVIFLADRYYHNYWSRRGVFQKEPFFILGTINETFLMSFGDFVTSNYYKFKDFQKFVGLYFAFKPVLLLNDPVAVQDVMIRDFNSFHNRGFMFDEEIDPLAAHLFNVDGQKWRDLRVKLSPTFTSGKLKGMFPVIRSCVKTLQEYLQKEVKAGHNTFQMRDLMARYTTNVISSVAFGIDNDCINNPDNVFRKMGLRSLELDLRQTIIQTIAIFLPQINTKLKVKLIPQDVEDFFMSITKQTIDHREASKSNERKDFMQLMIQLKNQGYLSADKEDDDESEKHGQTEMKKVTFNEIAANAFLFFVAGFETSSSTMNYVLFELSRNPDKQKKVHEELDRILKSVNVNDITYEMVSEMKYLDCCIDEALRIYPIVPALFRESTRDHKLSSSNMVIEKKTQILIPVMGMQRNPEIYDNPMEFRPERFQNSPHGNGKVDGLFYLPFGDGPR